MKPKEIIDGTEIPAFESYFYNAYLLYQKKTYIFLKGHYFDLGQCLCTREPSRISFLC